MVDPRPSDPTPDGRPPAADSRSGRDASVAAVDTASLFAGSTEVRLIHRGQEYRLRITRQGKLILTK